MERLFLFRIIEARPPRPDLLARGRVLVVGFGIDGDLKRLCASYPWLSRCFRRVIELQKVRRQLPEHFMMP
eukprot:COSAG01_NODE_5127_length_4469_cov_4.479405_1_plen_71_part_00